MEGGGRDVFLPFCVSEPQNAYFPILVPDSALLAVVWAPERRKKSTLLTCPNWEDL